MHIQYNDITPTTFVHLLQNKIKWLSNSVAVLQLHSSNIHEVFTAPLKIIFTFTRPETIHL
jgi:hypothetical protein